MISVHSLTRALRSFLQLVAALGVLIWGADVALAQCTNNNPDSDGDGVCNNTDVDDDGDGIRDAIEGTGDADGDGIQNRLDLDADGDGINDAIEGHDLNRSGVADRTPITGNNRDTNGNGLNRAFDGAESGGLEAPVQDSDGDGTPDYLDNDDDNDGILTRNERTDADSNGLPDYLQALCGDGKRFADEQCDDGNAANDDGCTSTCQVEPR